MRKKFMTAPAEKINEFDLTILDRDVCEGALPIIYFDKIARLRARWARCDGRGGTGTDASETSIGRTPAQYGALLAEPSGRNESRRCWFPAQLDDLGRRYPVMRGLDGAQSDLSHWSCWLRGWSMRAPSRGLLGDEGAGCPAAPIASAKAKGVLRCSSPTTSWLWARGFEGGVSDIDLLRRPRTAK